MANAQTEKKPRVKIYTPVFRVCFPSVFDFARQMEGSTGKPAYEVTAVFTPGSFSPEEKELWKKMIEAANVASIEKFKKPLRELPSNFKKPFRKGEEKEHLDGFGAGTIFVKLKTWSRPGVVASDGRSPITDSTAFYPGCYARATVGTYAYDKNGGKGVAFSLNNLQFVRDGEHLDGRTDPEDDFGGMGDESSATGADIDDLI